MSRVCYSKLQAAARERMFLLRGGLDQYWFSGREMETLCWQQLSADQSITGKSRKVYWICSKHLQNPDKGNNEIMHRDYSN